MVFFVEVFTVGRTSQRMCTSCATSTPSKTSEIVITEDRQIEINRNYLIAGGGIFMSLILFVISLQLYTCKKSTTARTNTKQKSCEEMRTSEESEEQHKIQQEIKHASKKITRSNLDQPVECDYHDIEEIIEIRHLTNFSNESQNYELPRILSDSRHSYSPLTVENSYLSPQFEDDLVEQQAGHCNKNNSDLYLQPINDFKYANVVSDC